MTDGVVEASKTGTTVIIYGVEYRIRGNGNPEFAKRVATLVDERMREVAAHAQISSQTQLAVLTLLNVTGELVRMEEEQRELSSAVTTRLRGLGDQLAEALSGRAG